MKLGNVVVRRPRVLVRRPLAKTVAPRAHARECVQIDLELIKKIEKWSGKRIRDRIVAREERAAGQVPVEHIEVPVELGLSTRKHLGAPLRILVNVCLNEHRPEFFGKPCADLAQPRVRLSPRRQIGETQG